MKSHGILFSGADVRAILDGRKTQFRGIMKPPARLEWVSHTNVAAGVVPYWRAAELRKRDGEWYESGSGQARFDDPEWMEWWTSLALYGPVGRKLWVREAWCCEDGDIEYRATYGDNYAVPVSWKPSIHMPQWAARIWLEVTEIRCQRLQDISEADATAEDIESFQDGSGFPDFTEKGIKFRTLETARESFATLWNSIYLPPAPVCGDGRRVVSYVSYPWAEDDFAARHPDEAASKTWNGKPLEIHANPWVWAYTFQRVEKP